MRRLLLKRIACQDKFILQVQNARTSTQPGLELKSIEWLGFFEAETVSVKSEWMRDEIIRIYNVPKEKIVVISTDPTYWLSDILKTYGDVAGGPKSK